MATVVNKKVDDFDVYIGRGSRWGNPYKGKNRDLNIRNYEQYLWKKIETGEIKESELLALDGKRLGCFCKPKRCHGDIIVNAMEIIKRRMIN